VQGMISKPYEHQRFKRQYKIKDSTILYKLFCDSYCVFPCTNNSIYS